MPTSSSTSLFSEPGAVSAAGRSTSSGTRNVGLHGVASSWQRRLGGWLTTPIGPSRDTSWHSLLPSTRRRTALLEARIAFRDALADIPRPGHALDHIRHARSLDELFELRNELFSLISCHHDQGEATRRIAALDPYFGRQLRRAASTRPALRRAR